MRARGKAVGSGAARASDLETLVQARREARTLSSPKAERRRAPALPGWLSLAALLVACAHSTPPPIGPHDKVEPDQPVVFETPPIEEITWLDSPAEARARAIDEKKPLIVFVRAGWSSPSVTMDQTIWRDARVLRESVRFIALRIDLTHDVEKLPEAVVREFGVESIPTTLIIASGGTVVGRYAAGAARAADVAEAMRRAR